MDEMDLLENELVLGVLSLSNFACSRAEMVLVVRSRLLSALSLAACVSISLLVSTDEEAVAEDQRLLKGEKVGVVGLVGGAEEEMEVMEFEREGRPELVPEVMVDGGRFAVERALRGWS